MTTTLSDNSPTVAERLVDELLSVCALPMSSRTRLATRIGLINAGLAALCLSALVPPLAHAQSQPAAWPAKPIRIVVAYPAGGVSDTVARALADKLAVQLGTPVVIENKAGASGSLGVDAVAKAAPDGYTLGFAAVSPLALNPHLGKSPFDPQKDIAPVVSVMYSLTPGVEERV